jgi:hypothetical protein
VRLAIQSRALRKLPARGKMAGVGLVDGEGLADGDGLVDGSEALGDALRSEYVVALAPGVAAFAMPPFVPLGSGTTNAVTTAAVPVTRTTTSATMGDLDHLRLLVVSGPFR